MVNKFFTLVKFGIVGILNTGIDIAVFTLLTYVGIPYLLSQSRLEVASLIVIYSIDLGRLGEKIKLRNMKWENLLNIQRKEEDHDENKKSCDSRSGVRNTFLTGY